ncbi:phosphocholine-specific phospholipase C [Sinomicrobium weinanense]|uniref:phospholipase C n=1 Tax=Sinomicrobium weinanense TaxID=2842200 RepID=A0A926JU95_9FLAO|nr:phospholipase C, phosphocholine-specific [Sinomicrobium weinanense]MBC9797352.1 phospholipase C, phosphocholine-specific [Sinomicrobium weinanense]MBU3124532.1 phospholipase C, phosphocholine-specific [Sinomicrobium weinanense]
MDTRRDFLKKAAMLTGGMGVSMAFPPSIQKALAINPDEGSTFYDAEHVVLLMQENRSFDHCFGTLRGVRGYNDPRAITLPDQNPVWLQSDKKGRTYAPFRLNMRETKATWMGDLPHSWENQVDARNDGKYDKWLEAKRTGRKAYQDIPFTLGYYNREDIPFNYAFADAFTVFDQHFCSALTGTTTNRHFFWTGTCRASPGAEPKVRNSEVYYNKEAQWKTFPERLEENGVSWKVYQNEISLRTGLEGEDESLLGNFTDNNLEWFSQFNVRFSEGHQRFLKKRLAELPSEIKELETKIGKLPKAQGQKLQNKLEQKKNQLQKIKEELEVWNPDNFEKLSEFHKNLHKKAFTTNINDPYYHETETITYLDNGEERAIKVPKGDILHQFRQDVNNGELPAVSWLAAPQKFSDHPSAPWYGAWYVSEVLDILTKNPEVWKKTVFILTYDENDGYFDHVPPFVAPNPEHRNAFSEGLHPAQEYVTLEEELKKEGMKPENARESPAGLGYRVPMVIASPWTRGGWVNSEVCDITSTLMFMETWLGKKTGKKIKEANISNWRRTICSDLTSAFRPYDASAFDYPEFVDRNQLMQEVYNAGFKEVPDNFKSLSGMEIEQARTNADVPFLPRQEPGIKDSCALPYELYVNGLLSKDRKTFDISLKAADHIFGKDAAGASFNVYAPGKYLQKNSDGSQAFEAVKTWPYAVSPGDTLQDTWPLDHFEDGNYHLRVYGPNGFYREFSGNADDPGVEISCNYEKTGRFIKKLSGNAALEITNRSGRDIRVTVTDNAYKTPESKRDIKKGSSEIIVIPTDKSHGWYDFSVEIEGGSAFGRRYAGRVETGKHAKTDPFMGGVV